MISTCSISQSNKNKFNNRRSCSGFSLVEVLVSLGIMVAITSVILTNQNTYTETLSLNNVVDEISLLLSQAQIYGVGVKEFVPGSDNFEIGYGISFSTKDAAAQKEFIFFADRNNDKRYNSGWSCPIDATSECVSKHFLSKGNIIHRVCYVRNNNTKQCSEKLDITFIRPNMTARLVFLNPSGNEISVPNLKNAEIEIFSTLSEQRRYISVFPTGQISVRSTETE